MLWNGKQCRYWPECSFRSSLICIYALCTHYILCADTSVPVLSGTTVLFRLYRLWVTWCAESDYNLQRLHFCRATSARMFRLTAVPISDKTTFEVQNPCLSGYKFSSPRKFLHYLIAILPPKCFTLSSARHYFSHCRLLMLQLSLMASCLIWCKNTDKVYFILEFSRAFLV